MTKQINRLYNSNKNNIIYIKANADATYWDTFWNENEKDWIENYTKNSTLKDIRFRLFEKYLFKGAKILEGGCGRGQFVSSLSRLGFNCTGIDYAEQTVKKLNKHLPELDIRLGDLTNLAEFKDNSFDGYYSGGVIEHFWEGYDSIRDEMFRVLKDQGILIMTFPFMSRSRRVEKKLLPIYKKESAPEGFYQFALNLKDTIEDFQNAGFELLCKLPTNGLHGYLERYPNNNIIKKLQNYQGKNVFIKKIISKVRVLFSNLGYGHTILLVFKIDK